MSYEDVYREIHGHPPPKSNDEDSPKSSSKPSFNKRKIAKASIIILLVLGSITGIAYAAQIYHLPSQLITPSPSLALYQANGITPIHDQQDLSSLWVWNSTNQEFRLTMVLKNNGTVSCTPHIALPTIEGWTFSVLPSPQPALIPAHTMVVNIKAAPVNPVGNFDSGIFIIIITVT